MTAMHRFLFAVSAAVLVAGVAAGQDPGRLPFPTDEPPLATPDAAPPNDARPDSTPRANASEVPRDALPQNMRAPQPIQPAQFQTPQPPEMLTPQPLPNAPRSETGFFPPTPSVQLRLTAPAVTANGQQVVYRMLVENRSRASANHVKVRVPVIADAPMEKATPEPASRDKDIVWNFDTLEAGATREITLFVNPAPTATDIKMCARVSFEFGQCVTTKLARPKLTLKQDAPAEGVLFDPLTYRVDVANPSSVDVANVRLTQTLGDGLEFEVNNVTPVANTGILDVQTNALRTERSWMLGTLRPGQRRSIEYRVVPKKSGKFDMKAVLKAGGVTEEQAGTLTVGEPKLGIRVTGPEAAYVGQPAAYQIVVSNLGSVALNNVRVNAVVPKGCEAIRISSDGQVFDAQAQWIMKAMKPGDSRTLGITLRTAATGAKKLAVGVRADRGLEQNTEVQTRFEGVAALSWKFDADPPVAKVGGEIRYTVNVTNTGSGPATNVVLKTSFPTSVTFKSATPQPAIGTGIVSFPADTIAPGQTAAYVVVVTAVKAEQAKFEFQLSADHLDKANPVKSEPTTTISGP